MVIRIDSRNTRSCADARHGLSARLRATLRDLDHGWSEQVLELPSINERAARTPISGQSARRQPVVNRLRTNAGQSRCFSDRQPWAIILGTPGLAARAIEGFCERGELLKAQIRQCLSERRDVDDDRPPRSSRLESMARSATGASISDCEWSEAFTDERWSRAGTRGGEVRDPFPSAG
jgi:hypothetical protein